MFDPVVLFFILGLLAGLVKSDLKIPDSFYNVLSIYLLLSIGIKGGIELYHAPQGQIVLPAASAIILSLLITSIAWLILKKLGRFSNADSVSIAAHYGSVSAVTFAVVTSYLKDKNIPFEEYMTVLLVLMEGPAIALAMAIYFWSNKRKSKEAFSFKKLFHEMFLSKSIILLMGGLVIGVFTEMTANKQLNFFFLDLFKGFLALFMLEMGIVTSGKVKDLKKTGIFLICFGIIMPIFSAVLGLYVAKFAGLSQGGAIVLATLAASASYIAAPAAIKMTIPEANIGLSLSTSLGITFPFNITVGISLYEKIAAKIFLN